MREKQPIAILNPSISYEFVKKQLINTYEKYCDYYDNDPSDTVIRKIIYILTAMIQLRNGSQISEACEALHIYTKPNTDLTKKINVTIAKSKAIKYKNNEQYTTPKRFRKMYFPKNWIDTAIPCLTEIQLYFQWYDGSLEKRVLDYMTRNFDCNTHTLRYIFLNYMIYEKKKDLVTISKFIGHIDTDKLTRYTQLKEIDKIYVLNI